jgi:hypothetical protein
MFHSSTLRQILILYSHLRLDLPDGLFPSGFPAILCVIFTTANYDYVKFVRYNLKVSHRRHACSCWHTELLYVLISYPHTKLCMAKSNDLSIASLKPKTKHKFRATDMLLYDIAQKY